MTGTTLTALLSGLAPPSPEHESAARERLALRSPAGDLGRLGELALWWATVRADPGAGPPADPVQVLGRQPRPLTGASRVSRLIRLDPPPAPPPAPPIEADPDQADPDQADPDQADPDQADPDQADPDQADPDQADPVTGAALAWGGAQADLVADSGADLILLSVAEPIAARTLAAHLLGLDPVEANGWPEHSGCDDAEWSRQTVRIRDLLRSVRPLPGRPEATLAALGSLRLVAAVGLLARAAARRTPVLLDGFGAAAAGLLVRETAPVAAGWWQAAGLSPHPVHARLLEALGLVPLTRLELRTEDGTGGLLGLAVLDLAAGLLAADEADGDDPAGAKGPDPT